MNYKSIVEGLLFLSGESGISLEEYTNPNEDVIQRLIEYVSIEYDQTSVYSDSDDE